MSFWLKDLDLTYSDKTIIEEGKKLSDRHMHATHKLLSAEFPSLEGLQSTLLAETGGFLPVNGTAGVFFFQKVIGISLFSYTNSHLDIVA